MSRNLNISVLVAARDEYIKQLKEIITPLIIQGFNSVYADAIKLSENNKVIMKFQELLKAIPTWNQTILQQESVRIKKKCPYIMDIVTAIFVSNVKILASIRLKGNNDNIKVKIPTSDLFIHGIYIQSGERIFYDPFLFYHRTNSDYSKLQENKRIVRNMIYDSIDETIRQMIPFDDILKEYLANALDDNVDSEYSDEDPDDDEEESIEGDELRNDDVFGDALGESNNYQNNEQEDPDDGSDSDEDEQEDPTTEETKNFSFSGKPFNTLAAASNPQPQSQNNNFQPPSSQPNAGLSQFNSSPQESFYDKYQQHSNGGGGDHDTHSNSGSSSSGYSSDSGGESDYSSDSSSSSGGSRRHHSSDRHHHHSSDRHHHSDSKHHHSSDRHHSSSKYSFF